MDNELEIKITKATNAQAKVIEALNNVDYAKLVGLIEAQRSILLDALCRAQTLAKQEAGS